MSINNVKNNLEMLALPGQETKTQKYGNDLLNVWDNQEWKSQTQISGALSPLFYELQLKTRFHPQTSRVILCNFHVG